MRVVVAVADAMAVGEADRMAVLLHRLAQLQEIVGLGRELVDQPAAFTQLSR